MASDLCEVEWEIGLRNHKDAAQTVTVIEPVPGDWQVLQSTHAYEKVEAHTLEVQGRRPQGGRGEGGLPRAHPILSAYGTVSGDGVTPSSRRAPADAEDSAPPAKCSTAPPPRAPPDHPDIVVRCMRRLWWVVSKGVARWWTQRLSHTTRSPSCHSWR